MRNKIYPHNESSEDFKVVIYVVRVVLWIFFFLFIMWLLSLMQEICPAQTTNTLWPLGTNDTMDYITETTVTTNTITKAVYRHTIHYGEMNTNGWFYTNQATNLPVIQPITNGVSTVDTNAFLSTNNIPPTSATNTIPNGPLPNGLWIPGPGTYLITYQSNGVTYTYATWSFTNSVAMTTLIYNGTSNYTATLQQ